MFFEFTDRDRSVKCEEGEAVTEASQGGKKGTATSSLLSFLFHRLFFHLHLGQASIA